MNRYTKKKKKEKKIITLKHYYNKIVNIKVKFCVVSCTHTDVHTHTQMLAHECLNDVIVVDHEFVCTFA